MHLFLLVLLGLFAGAIGALAGVGGGIIITPVLALYFGIPIHQAIGVSLVSVIATSTATSSVYVERHLTDVRLGMTLELTTTLGAAIAAMVAAYVNRRVLAALFAAFLLYSAGSLIQKAWKSFRARALENGASESIDDYEVKRYPLGLAAALTAGGFSGLLGIGGGPIKVPVMHIFMGVPLRVATATSNFMIGVTAATSAFIYYGRGDVPVLQAAPVVAGVFIGSLVAARLAHRVRATHVLLLLIVVMLYLAAQMILKVSGGGGL